MSCCYTWRKTALNNKEVDKDKEIIYQRTQEEQILLSLDILAEILSADTEWQGNVKEYLREKHTNNLSVEIIPLIKEFFYYLYASGTLRKTEEDTKRHFVNWVCKQRKSMPNIKAAKSASQTEFILTNDSLDKYKSIEQRQ